MARDRSNVGFGPTAITVTGTTAAADASTWVRWGPVKNVNLAYIATFSTASTNGNTVKLQTRISSGSTKGQQSFTVIKASAAGSAVWGSTGMCCFVRGYSSVLANTRSVTLTLAAVV